MSSSLEILRGFDIGRIAAILQKVSGGGSDEEKREKLEAILRDELRVQLVERILKLIDRNGRVIPGKDLQHAVCDANKSFHLVQPEWDPAARLMRFQKAFKPGPVMSVAQFESESSRLIAEISGDKILQNLLSGIYLPIILPKLENFTDYGKIFKEGFLSAVKFAYEQQFSGRKFCNWWENDLAGKISIVPESRHDKLVEKMKRGFVVVIYFPNPLQGFSVLAVREQMAALPESLILAGGFDTASAMAMYPDVLARDFKTPGYDLSALSWRSPVGSLDFRADDGRLIFGSRGRLGRAVGALCSSGLLFPGSAA